MYEELGIVKLIYALFGKWFTRIVGFVGLGLGVLWALPWVAGQYVKIGQAYADVTWSTQSFLDLVLGLSSLAVLGFILVVFFRITGWAIYRGEMREIKSDIELIKRRLNIIAPNDESEAEDG